MVAPAPTAATARPCLRAAQVDELLDAFFAALHVDPGRALHREQQEPAASPASAGASLAARVCARAAAAAARSAAPATPPRPQRKQGGPAPPALLRGLALRCVWQA